MNNEIKRARARWNVMLDLCEHLHPGDGEREFSVSVGDFRLVLAEVDRVKKLEVGIQTAIDHLDHQAGTLSPMDTDLYHIQRDLVALITTLPIGLEGYEKGEDDNAG